MEDISRVDRIIALGLVVLLMALLAVALGHRSSPSPAGSPLAARARSGNPPGSAGSTSAGTPTSSILDPSSSTTQPTSTTSGSVVPVPGPVSAVGDSIMLDIQPYLTIDIPGARVDGLVSRQFETGIGVIRADRADGTLGNVLIVELGTNGTVTPADFDALMQAAAGVRRVVIVNVDVPRPWEQGDNAVLAAGVARYPGVAVLADWYSLSSDHPDWFTPDQVHLEPAGARALADLVAGFA